MTEATDSAGLILSLALVGWSSANGDLIGFAAAFTMAAGFTVLLSVGSPR